MESKFAFTAQFWGDGAVICRAVENLPGPVVEQQFGEFPSWTQAQTFAGKLNEGLDLDPLSARRIVTSSILATACVVQEALDSSAWGSSTTEAAARAAQLRCVLAELALALTMCHSAPHLSETSARRVLFHGRRALQNSLHFLNFHDGDYDQLRNIAAGTVALQSAMQQVSACLPACLPALTTILPHTPPDVPPPPKPI